MFKQGSISVLFGDQPARAVGSSCLSEVVRLRGSVCLRGSGPKSLRVCFKNPPLLKGFNQSWGPADVLCLCWLSVLESEVMLDVAGSCGCSTFTCLCHCLTQFSCLNGSILLSAASHPGASAMVYSLAKATHLGGASLSSRFSENFFLNILDSGPSCPSLPPNNLPLWLFITLWDYSTSPDWSWLCLSPLPPSFSS